VANLKFDKEITALLVIDPYNDFISEGGKRSLGNRLQVRDDQEAAHDCDEIFSQCHGKVRQMRPRNYRVADAVTAKRSDKGADDANDSSNHQAAAGACSKCHTA